MHDSCIADDRAASGRALLLKRSRQLYYGWPLLAALSIAETISWGVLYYSFSVFIRPIEAEMGWSRTQVTGAFSIALLVSGVAAVPVGHWLDARGARGVMTVGALAGSLLLLALSRVESLPMFYGVWAGLGVVMAMVLYEPAFAVVARWFVRHRDRALTILTLVGGLASTVVVPLATWLVQRQGWRMAVTSLAALLALTTVPLHALFLRRDPATVGQRPDGDDLRIDGRSTDAAPAVPPASAPATGDTPLWRLTAAFSLASVATVATSIHLIPYLVEQQYPPMVAGTAMGAVGLMQLPGRLLFAPMRRTWSWQRLTASVFLIQGGSLILFAVAPLGAVLALFVCCFGIGNGLCTLLRTSTLAELYGDGRFARVSGFVALFGMAARAAGPILAALALAASNSYGIAFGGLAVILALAALLVAESDSSTPPPSGARATP